MTFFLFNNVVKQFYNHQCLSLLLEELSLIVLDFKYDLISLSVINIYEDHNSLDMQAAPEQIAYNQIIPGSEQPGFSPIYRQKGRTKLISTPHQDFQTVGDILRQCRDKFGSKRGFGEIIVTVQKGEKGEDIEVRTVKEYTYGEIFNLSQNLGRSLTARKLAFTEDLYGMKTIGIYSRNRLEWFITDWACSLFGYVLAPLYDSLGKQNLAHCVSLTGITTLLVSAKTAGELVKFHQKGTLNTLISFDKLDEDLINKFKEEGLQVLDFWQLVEEGSKLEGINSADVKITHDDVFSFCFTSGTTGPPKAAIIKQSNILGAITPFVFHEDIKFRESDVHLSYLPLPHLMERTIIYGIFLVGAFLVISSGNVQKVRDDSAACKSTIFLSVPRIYNRIVDTVNGMINQMCTDEAKRPAIEKAVFEKVRQTFGGNVRLAVTGSAPINPAVQQTMQKIIQCPLIQGYGQTQSPCGILFSRKTSTNFSVMQQISTGAEIRLADIPQMKYTSKDTDAQGRSTPRGQILVRGPQVYGGYYKRDDLTKQAIGQDGWLRTGDVGEVTPSLGFKIIDRKKNIFKLQQGEYVVPDRVEACYMRSGLLEEVFLHGSSNQNFAVAVVSPNKAKVTQIAGKLNVAGSFEEICTNKEVRTAFLGQMNAYGRKHGLLGYEVAKNIFFETGGFGTKGILTNTQKLMRFEARTCYKDQIEAMYAEGELKV